MGITVSKLAKGISVCMGGFWRRRGFLWDISTADEHGEFMLGRHRRFLIGIHNGFLSYGMYNESEQGNSCTYRGPGDKDFLYIGITDFCRYRDFCPHRRSL
jgi:hypothetical protein